jgi:hypothetical protein
MVKSNPLRVTPRIATNMIVPPSCCELAAAEAKDVAQRPAETVQRSADEEQDSERDQIKFWHRIFSVENCLIWPGEAKLHGPEDDTQATRNDSREMASNTAVCRTWEGTLSGNDGAEGWEVCLSVDNFAREKVGRGGEKSSSLASFRANEGDSSCRENADRNGAGRP